MEPFFFNKTLTFLLKYEDRISIFLFFFPPESFYVIDRRGGKSVLGGLREQTVRGALQAVSRGGLQTGAL